MAALIIDGRVIAADVRSRVKSGIERLPVEAKPVTLATVIVGTPEAAEIYIRQKEKACSEVGIVHAIHRLPATASEHETGLLLAQLSSDPSVAGILLEMPVPPKFNAGRLVHRIAPEKDADGVTPTNLGRLLRAAPVVAPATVESVMEILRVSAIPLKGAEAVIVNHSAIIGKPLAMLLLQHDATVSVAHVHTRDLAHHTSGADILVVGVGVPGLIRRQHVRPGATVIDVGMNRVDGKVCGDVAFDEVKEVAGRITPVPGGVGPVTVAMLLQNCLTLVRRNADMAG